MYEADNGVMGGVTIYIYIYIYIHIHIHMVPPSARQPPQCYPFPAPPPPQPPPWGRPTIYHHPSRSHMLIWYTYMPMHYITGYLHAVFTTAYNMPMQSIYKVLQPMKYLDSSHMLATIKIS